MHKVIDFVNVHENLSFSIKHPVNMVNARKKVLESRGEVFYMFSLSNHRRVFLCNYSLSRLRSSGPVIRWT